MAAVSHAPQNVAAPKVYSSGTWNDDTAFNMIGAGGNFSTELNASWDATTPAALGYGHSIGATNVTPPGGDQPVPTLTCTSCHDPHGASSSFDTKINIFRNLKVNAQDAGAHSGVKLCPDGNTAGCNDVYGGNSPVNSYRNLKSYVGGINGTYFGGSETDNAAQVIWPVYRGTLAGIPATDAPNSNAYGADNVIGRSFSHWCSQCHDNFHKNSFGVDIDEAGGKWFFNDEVQWTWGSWTWLRHPTNVTMPRSASAGCTGTCHPSKLDRTNYSLSLIQTGKGIPVTASRLYGVSGAYDTVYYLPYAPPSPVSMDSLVPGGHRVFCLSCHFAHGGPHYDALRWDYTSAVSSGSQFGNPIPSNKGCQLCHNRGG